MAKTSTESTSKNATQKVTSTKSNQKATAILKADHKQVDALFKKYEVTNSDKVKKQLVDEICKELTIHATVEEEIFYPSVQKALKDHELVPEATVEHDSLKKLIEEIKGIEPNGDMYDAKVKVLSEYVKHHVKEEEKEMFPKANKTGLDMTELGMKITDRKQVLSSQYQL
jgi:hemerythrin superfamily protein